jgi:hypothetical protein
VSVDLARVRAQLRRWQEHLLYLTKANLLLSINRSRVSKLRVNDPAPHELFGYFAAPDEATLILPCAVKVPRRDDEAPEDTGYRIEPGGLSFDAAPADLYRRLRRIHDNVIELCALARGHSGARRAG